MLNYSRTLKSTVYNFNLYKNLARFLKVIFLQTFEWKRAKGGFFFRSIRSKKHYNKGKEKDKSARARRKKGGKKKKNNDCTLNFYRYRTKPE